MTRQRAWQLKMEAEGKCVICAEPAKGKLCEEHRRKSRESSQRRRDAVKHAG